MPVNISLSALLFIVLFHRCNRDLSANAYWNASVETILGTQEISK